MLKCGAAPAVFPAVLGYIQLKLKKKKQVALLLPEHCNVNRFINYTKQVYIKAYSALLQINSWIGSLALKKNLTIFYWLL